MMENIKDWDQAEAWLLTHTSMAPDDDDDITIHQMKKFFVVSKDTDANIS